MILDYMESKLGISELEKGNLTEERNVKGRNAIQRNENLSIYLKLHLKNIL